MGAAGVARDLVKAYEWYEKSATAGHPVAQNNMGSFCYVGKPPMKGPGKFVVGYYCIYIPLKYFILVNIYLTSILHHLFVDSFFSPFLLNRLCTCT